MKNKFQYLNALNLYLLISAKKTKFFAYWKNLSRSSELDLIQSLQIFVYHISFYLKSSNIGIIFDNLTILWCHFKEWKVKTDMRWFYDMIHYVVMPVSGLAVSSIVFTCNILIIIYLPFSLNFVKVLHER